ncbi:hypothetical protein FKM82_002415 [Ascaphus truei]
MGALHTSSRASGSRELFFRVDTHRVVHIHSVIILRRSDKRKDRVEISPEQLSAATTEADISFCVCNICIIISVYI